MKLRTKDYCVYVDSTIKVAMEAIDMNLTGAVFVINNKNQVIGVLTDGDIRRAILKVRVIENTIEPYYNRNFKFATHLENRKKVKEYMILHKIRQLPILDKEKRLVEVCFLDDLISYDKKDNFVFILAGGMGTRLKPLTDNIPKPMLNVGSKPILEHIIESFKEFGYYKFIISLNYMGQIIEDYFGDGSKFDVSITYVKEKNKLGTAGSIKLAKDILNKPFIVINGDILTKMDFDDFLNCHIENKFDITVGVRNYEIKVPYGIMITEDKLIKSLQEKPTYSFYINSGVYVVNPELINYIPSDEQYNMTDLINNVIDNENKPGTYPITEYWADIGQLDDYRKANEDIKKI